MLYYMDRQYRKTLKNLYTNSITKNIPKFSQPSAQYFECFSALIAEMTWIPYVAISLLAVSIIAGSEFFAITAINS